MFHWNYRETRPTLTGWKLCSLSTTAGMVRGGTDTIERAPFAWRSRNAIPACKALRYVGEGRDTAVANVSISIVQSATCSVVFMI